MERTCRNCLNEEHCSTGEGGCIDLHGWEEIPQEPSPKSERTEENKMTMEKKTVKSVLSEFTSNPKMKVSDAESSLKRIIIGEFVERLKKETKESTSIVSVFNGRAGLVRHEKYILEDDIDRIYQEAIK